MSEVSKETWERAQQGEVTHHAGNFNLNDANRNHYHEIYRKVFKFVDPQFDFNVQSKSIMEIGPGVFSALLYCSNVNKKSYIVEPLPMPQNVIDQYKDKNIDFLKGTVEELDLPKVDEVWVFNVMQHIWNPEVFVKKLKSIANKILFFEPINTPLDNLHIHSYTLDDFKNFFGQDVAKQYNGGSEPNFHTAHCAYGIWDKASEKNLNLSVIGIGKLGLCMALSLEKSGYNIVGVDISEEYIEKLNKKEYETDEEFVVDYLNQSKNFLATTDLKTAVDHANVFFTVVATPSLPNGGYDHSQLFSVVEKLKSFGVQETQKHLVVCCTVMPKTCDEIQTQLEQYNWIISYNPEFIAQGTVIRNQENPDMVLIGEANREAGDELEAIYRKMCKNKPKFNRMSRISAEITKIGLNCFLVTKIAYANMVGDVAESVGAETDKILSAIGDDSRIGNKFLRYGYGYGGPCLKPEQLVQTSNGLRKISDIFVGDQVLTHAGVYRKVIKNYARPFKGDLFVIKTTGFSGLNSAMTENHPVFVERKNKERTFVAAGDIRPTDKILFPLLKEKEKLIPSIEFINANSEKVSIKLNEELMKMFGFFISEGCVSNSSKSRREDRIMFTFHEKELDYAIFIKDTFEKFFNRKVLIKNKKGQNSICAVAKHVPLAKWFISNFGKGSQNKKIPYTWLNLPDSYIKEFLKGIWYGDGSKSNNIYTLGMTSREVINFVSLCLFKFGIKHTIRVQKEKVDKNGILHKKCYYLKIADSQNIKKMSEQILTDMKIDVNKKHTYTDNLVDNGYLKYKISNIEKEPYNGLVYNLEVDIDESYALENCIVHNCLPRDARAFGKFAEDIGSYGDIPYAADSCNDKHLTKQIEIYQKSHSKDKEIFFDCVTYKKESNILEESQQLKFAVGLAKAGYKVVIEERKEVMDVLKKEYKNLFQYKQKKKSKNKRVISFTLFGLNPFYIKGAIKNAKMAPLFYPDWECRFYLDKSLPEEIKDELRSCGAVVIEKDPTTGYNALFWRFEPMYDNTVDVWISRDVDSRFSLRETSAVNDWLKTDKTFHLMRDSHNHDLYPIMAGMFGVNNTLCRSRYPNINFRAQGNVNAVDTDQQMLKNEIWQFVAGDHVCHEHWAHHLPVSNKLTHMNGRNPETIYSGQGVYGHVTNRRNNFPWQFANGSINKPFPVDEQPEFGLYLGQKIKEDDTPVWNEEVQWEYELRGIKW